MGLAQTFRNAAQKILDMAGDVPVFETFVKVTPGVYTPETDTTADLVVEHPNTRMFLYGLREDELDWFKPEWVMQKCIIAKLDLTAVTQFDSHDYFMIRDEGGVARRWEIQRVKKMPTGAATIFFLRQT